MNALADELPRADREELEGLDTVREKWTRYRRVLERSILQAESPREWPTPQQQHAIGKALGTSEQAERLEKIDQPPLRRMMFGGMLFNSLRADMMNDAAPYQPKPGQLEAIFEKLDHTERDTLMQLPAEEMSQKLLQRFRSQNNDPAYLEFDKQRMEFQEFTRKLFAEFQWGGRFGNPPGGRDRPPFRPGGPEGGEGPDRPPRDRNGRPRPPGPPND